MFNYKSQDRDDIEQERRTMIWQMLAAQLDSAHQKLMSQYGMDVATQPQEQEEENGSLMRGPRNTDAAAPAESRQLPAPGAKTGPLRGGGSLSGGS